MVVWLRIGGGKCVWWILVSESILVESCFDGVTLVCVGSCLCRFVFVVQIGFTVGIKASKSFGKEFTEFTTIIKNRF